MLLNQAIRLRQIAVRQSKMQINIAAQKSFSSHRFSRS